ncbi:MAG: hypothetical protein IJ996_00120 [Clostridia bacterium]|nr:hypothetical protein [Clostridia bacterium]
MTVTIYNDADFLAAYKQKNKVLGVFWGVTLAYLAVCIAMVIFHVSLPYASKLDTIPQAITYVCSALYVIFVFPFMGIKYSRVRKYLTMLSFLSTGLKMTETNYFYTFRSQTLQKDNIDVLSCIFATWSKKREEWLEREVYADVEKSKPEIGEGDLVRYVTQSNILVQYEVLEKHAYEFYEEDDEEEYEDGEEPQDEVKNKQNEGEEI